MILVKGTCTIPIGTEEFLVRCPSCEAHSPAEALILSRYYHIYWVPIVPLGKEATLICTKCGLQRPNRSFDADLISNYDEIRSKFKHPYFSYLGISIIVFMVVGSILAAMIK